MRIKTAKKALICLLVLGLAIPPGLMAQDTGQATQTQQNYVYSQEELDEMLAPIALYPDELLSQILMASTYPLEVVEADRWLKKNPNLTGDQLDEALKNQPWDVSVKSLCQYSQVLSTMSENLAQTSAVGNAFLDQQNQVMDTIQSLRQRARAQENLRSTDQQTVTVEGPDVVIVPANPDVVYVPVYDPCWVYGPWWWPTCTPFWFWYPGLIVAGVFAFGPPIFFDHRGFWCGFHWRRHEIFVDLNRTLWFHRPAASAMHGGIETWQHNPIHRRGVAYQNETVRERFGQTARPGAEARRNFRGFPQLGPKTEGAGITGQPVAPRGQGLPQLRQPTGITPPSVPGGRQIERTQPAPQIQRAEPGEGFTSPGRSFETPKGGGGSFEGLGRGPEVRQQSERGWESMGGHGGTPRGGAQGLGGGGTSRGFTGGGGGGAQHRGR
jgi:hypothetical protein